MRQKLLFHIDASVSSCFSSFKLESQSHILSQNRGEMQGMLEGNQRLEPPFCCARRNQGEKLQPSLCPLASFVVGKGRAWPRFSGTGWTHPRAGWVWDAKSNAEQMEIFCPLCIPLVAEGCPSAGGTLLLSFWPGLELLNDGRFMDFFLSSNIGLAFFISALRGPFLLIFLVPHRLTLLGRAPLSRKCLWHGWKAPV